MKKYNKYIFASMLLGASAMFTACSDSPSCDGGESNRLFMPMFRLTQNLNSTTDKYHCDITTRLSSDVLPNGYTPHVNDIMMIWYQVNDAAGYELKAKVQGTEWDRDEVLDTILTADQYQFIHEDLQYSVGYLYAIRALASIDGCDGKGKMKPEYLANPNDPRNSKWYGYGDGSHQNDMSRDDSREQTGCMTTGMRYDVPSVFWTEDVTKTTMKVYFNTLTDQSTVNSYKDFLDAGATTTTSGDDVNWDFDQICVVPSADNPTLPAIYHDVTDAERAQGYVEFTGLESNAAYIVSGMNNKVARYYDRQYNSTMVRMQGDPGEPIKLKWYCDPNDTILHNNGNQVGTVFGSENLQACRIDTVLTNYMSDNTIAEGQVFYLEGGKTYYTCRTVEMTKGFTLETDPADIAAGKGRATVLQGVGYTNADHTATNANNWGLCRNARSGAENGVCLAIQPIVFNNINFQPEYWYNYFDQKASDGNSKFTINGNYFMNMYSQGLSFSLAELKMSNCTFQGHVRGFIRFQGPNRQIIEKLTVENCVFYNEGGYDTNGRGYSWFAGPGNNRNSNFYKNFTFRNNTIVNSPRHALVTENKQLAWPEGTTWNITVENNTFVNFSPRSNNKAHGLMFEIAYPPKNSKITCKKNLFVFAGNPNEVVDGVSGRDFYMKGMVVNPMSPVYDFADNYSTVVPAYQNFKSSNNGTTLLDGMFAQNAFSNSSTGAGYNKGAFNVGGFGETKIKFGDNLNENEDDACGYQLTAEELFKNPAPEGTVNAKETFTRKAYYHSTLDGFYINKTEKVMNHPIYKKQIGDPRWFTGASWNGEGSSSASAKSRRSYISASWFK
ncbi:MAG: hypothetical protein II489_09625 [Bacteroidaceae bacterium]|nr:hypothetical protein [Bacteroidaceae bacterium]